MHSFTSFLQAAEHFARLAVAAAAAEHAGLERAAVVLERQAKQEIGTYQEQAGPFAGWAELADSTKAERLRLGYTENDPGLRSGEMQDSIHHRVGAGEAEVGSDDDKLVFFELGTSKQAPRSVLGLAAVKKGQEVAEIVGGRVAFALMGEGVVGGRMEIEDRE